MLKEEEIDKKRLNGIQNLKKRSIEISDVKSTKVQKIENDNVVNKIYQIPEVCIFIVKFNFDMSVNILKICYFLISVNYSK